MDAKLRLLVGCAAALLLLASPAHAAEQRLTLVGPRPVAASLTTGTAKFGVTVRNDSRAEHGLSARIVLDTGGSLPADGTDVRTEVGTEKITMSLAVDTTLPRLAPEEVARVNLTFTANPTPGQAVSGVLVIAPEGGGRVRPLSVPLTITPAAETAPQARFEKARIEPDSPTLIVHRLLPSFIHLSDADTGGSTSARVAGIAPGSQPIPEEQRTVSVASDTGGHGTLDVKVAGVGAEGTTSRITVDPKKVDRRGTYDAKIPLDDAAEKSPELTVKVIASDHWLWALAVLALGAWIAYKLLQSREMDRPKRVLQLALTSVEARNRVNRDAANKKKLTQPYTLDDLFPPAADWTKSPVEEPGDDKPGDPEALRIYAAVGGAASQEELDAQATRVADLEARVNAWPDVCAKATALRTAIEAIDDDDAAIKVASQDLLEPSAPKSESATKAYMTELDEQVEAVREWCNARELLETALALFHDVPHPPLEHNPSRWAPDLAAAASLADLKRCGIVGGLCRDVHVLRALALERGKSLQSERDLGVAGQATRTIDVKAAPPAVGGEALSRQLTADIRKLDRAALVVTTLVVGTAYIVLVYKDPWGSIPDYLTALTAGAGGTFASSWKLLPWYSTFKPPKKA